MTVLLSSVPTRSLPGAAVVAAVRLFAVAVLRPLLPSPVYSTAIYVATVLAEPILPAAPPLPLSVSLSACPANPPPFSLPTISN